MSSSRTIHPIVCVHGSTEHVWLEKLHANLGGQIQCLDHDGSLPELLRTFAAQHPDHDLVIVAAGTLLPPHWFERLCHAMQQEHVIAVQALTPAWLPGVDVPASRDELALLDQFCFAHGSRHAFDSEHLDAPLLAIRADAVASLGESDLDLTCLGSHDRALRLETLLVATVTEKPSRAETVANSPHLELAHRIQCADMLPESGYPGLDSKPVLLHIMHGWGGGSARWVADIAAADDRHHHLLLEAHGDFKRRHHGERFILRHAKTSGPALREFTPSRTIASTVLAHPNLAEFLRSIISDFAVDAVLVSSVIGHSLDVLATGLPTLLLVHDHYPLWPLLHSNFSDPDQRFDQAQMQRELAAVGSAFEFAERDPEHWQRLRCGYTNALLKTRAIMIAPTRSAMAAQLSLAPELAALPQHIIGHGIAEWATHSTPVAPPPRGKLRLVVPGRVRKGKGAELLQAALPRLREYAEIVLLGAGAEGMEFFAESGMHVVLEYQRDDLPELLATLAPDAALILPTVAETFSYTLSEMFSLGIPVIASRIGALAERISDGENGLLVEPEPDALVARIATLVNEPGVLAAIRERVRKVAVSNREDMAAAYAKVLNLAPRCGIRYHSGIASPEQANLRAERNSRVVLEQNLQDNERKLAEQIAEGKRRGLWANQVSRELAELGSKHLTLQDELEQRTDWALSLDKQVQPLRVIADQHEALLRSRSWRISAPMRKAAEMYRNTRADLGFRWSRLHSLRGRVRGSLGRRGVLGTMARIRQEFALRYRPTQIVDTPRSDDVFTPFALPSSDAPRVSLVIPAYNKFEYTSACLKSIAQHADGSSFEVIVVDDASTDTSTARLDEITGIQVLRNEHNLGFIGACNSGAKLARGEFIVFLNNDTLVTANWLQALLECFQQRDDTGLVGARLVYPDGRLQEAGGIVFNDGSAWNYGRLEDPEDPRVSFRRRADYCSGAAIMLRRALFEQLGGFDRRYQPAYYEDTDLAFAVRNAGHEVYVEPRATVVHFEGVTSGTDTSTGIKRYQVINREHFADKWRAQLAHQPAPLTGPESAHLAATHAARERVLIVDASTPTPDQDAGSVRLVNLMRILRSMGCQVTFLPDNLARIGKYTALLQADGVEVLYHPFVSSVPAFYRARGGEFGLIMISRHYVAAHHLGLARAYAPRATLVFDTVDLHYLREQREAELNPRPELQRQAANTRTQELKLIREFDVTAVVSVIEKKLLAQDAPRARVEVLSTVHAVVGCRAPFARRDGMLFLGGFQHPPNIDAMLWFVRDVLPLIHAQLPALQLHIVGSNVTAQIEALAGPDVIVHGYVEDIEPLLDGSRVSVAPLRYGAGVKGKVNMAMSYGLPVVATPMAVEGIELAAGEDVLVAADAEGFAAAVIRLYQDADLWQRLSRNGLDNVRQQFSFAVAQATLERLLARD